MAKSPERIVDEQVRRWNLERGLQAPRTPAARVWPIITVSREFGARGRALAGLLSERLGFTLWDKSLVQAIAAASGGEQSFVEMLDEHHRLAIDEVIYGFVSNPRHTNVRYHRTLLSVVHAIADKGGSIIVGRGANYVCERSSTLALRVVCPFDERVRIYAEREGLTPRQARKAVALADHERGEFIQRYFRRDVGEASAYDLILNSASFSLEEMADLVLSAYEKKAGRRPPEVGRTSEAAASTMQMPVG
jgi:cytidylate kinase